MKDAERNLSRIVGTEVVAADTKIGPYTIHFVTAGKGEPVLLIHGANVGWGQWYPNIAALAKKFRIYAIDLPGAGQSTRVDFRKTAFEADYVQTVKQFLQAHKLSRVVVIGHSFGAAIALKLAANEPELISKLVLVSPLGFSSYVPGKQKPITLYPLAKLIAKTAFKPTRQNIHKFLLDPTRASVKLPEEFVHYYHKVIESGTQGHPILFMSSLTKRFKLKPEINLENLLEKIKHPTLVVLGDQDPIVPTKKIIHKVKLIPGVKVEVFTATGHVAGQEKSAEFNRLLMEFLGQGKN